MTNENAALDPNLLKSFIFALYDSLLFTPFGDELRRLRNLPAAQGQHNEI